MRIRQQSLRKVSDLQKILGILALIGAIAGCANTREPYPIAPVSVTQTPERKLAKPIAFFHGKAFRETLHTLEPYSNMLYLPLKTGERSDQALRAAYLHLFDSATEVASRDALSGRGGLSASLALIEPKEVRLDYYDASARGWGPFYSRVSYRFSLFDANGASVAEWRVRGFAHFESTGVRWSDEFQTFAEAPRRAIEAAMANFIRNFERVPELVRWNRGLPVTESNVLAAGQVTHQTTGDHPGVEARYPGVLSLRVNRIQLPKPPEKSVTEETAAPALLALHLTLRNESPRRLLLDPGEVEWVLDGVGTLEPLPAPLVAEFMSGRPLGVTGGVMSPGVGMLPALFGALATASSVSDRKQQFAAWMGATSREILKDDVTLAGATGSGVIYLRRPVNREGGELVVRVVDLDDALRYTVRLPLPAR
jgi:hypothetical protein